MVRVAKDNTTESYTKPLPGGGRFTRTHSRSVTNIQGGDKGQFNQQNTLLQGDGSQCVPGGRQTVRRNQQSGFDNRFSEVNLNNQYQTQNNPNMMPGMPPNLMNSLTSGAFQQPPMQPLPV